MVWLCDVVTRLLRYMVDEDYFPLDKTIKELQTQRRFSKLRLRPGFREFLIRLEERNQLLSTPLFAHVNETVLPNLQRFRNQLSWNNGRFFGSCGQLLHGIRFVVNSMLAASGTVIPG